MRRRIYSVSLGAIFFILYLMPTEDIFKIKGNVYFRSEAPLELIEATSQDLKGIVDFSKGAFAFSVAINSFQGFNSPLQREHFNENYLESDKYERATFTGKIIENVDASTNGKFEIRAKGKLVIHGVEQERIIPVTLTIHDKNISFESQFTVLLREHNIAIPKIVYQKISEEIVVNINGEGFYE